MKKKKQKSQKKIIGAPPFEGMVVMTFPARVAKDLGLKGKTDIILHESFDFRGWGLDKVLASGMNFDRLWSKAETYVSDPVAYMRMFAVAYGIARDGFGAK